MVFLGTLILAADLVFVLSFPAHNIPGWWPLSWKIASGPNGSVVSTKAGQSTIWIEVEHPGCTPSSGGNWLAPAAISYTPWSVTITMSIMNSPPMAHAATHNSGRNPIDGSLRSAITLWA
jgi:hypothetical protein